jgi:DNA-binding NtrC family response regulator
MMMDSLQVTSSKPEQRAAERKPTLLVVDDEPWIRLSLSEFLRDCGFNVIEANDAEEAIQFVRSYSIVIDLVLTDIRMPGKTDGIGLAKWIGQKKPRLPVLLCSGHVQKDEVSPELCKGKPFFRKPYDLEKMASEIRRTLKLGPGTN